MRKIIFLLAVLWVGGEAYAQNNALAFDGTPGANNFVDIPHVPAFDFPNGFTLEAWLNFNQVTRTGNGIDWHGIFGKPAYNSSIGLMLENKGTKRFRFYHPGLSSSVTDYLWPTVAANTWYHIALTYDGAQTRIFINGSQVATKCVSGSINTNTNPIRLGYGTTGPYPFDGLMDEVRIWDYARCSNQIQSTMNCSISGNQFGLLAAYDFNQGVAGGNNSGLTTLTDQSGNGNDANLNGFTLSGSNSNWQTSSNGVSGTCSPVYVNCASNEPFPCGGSAPLGPPATPVPTLSQWGLILFGLTVLCLGGIVIWRRRYAFEEAV